MNKLITEKLERYQSAHIYATYVNDEKISLVRLGSYDEFRHRYNQMVGLIGAKGMRALKGATPGSTYMPRGSWSDYYNPNFSFEESLVREAVCQPPSELGDKLGLQGYSEHWPLGLANMAGMKNAIKSMGEVGNVFYSHGWRTHSSLSRSMDLSAVKRAEEGLAELHREGRTAYQEEQLLEFMKLMTTARELHLYHSVPTAL